MLNTAKSFPILGNKFTKESMSLELPETIFDHRVAEALNHILPYYKNPPPVNTGLAPEEVCQETRKLIKRLISLDNPDNRLFGRDEVDTFFDPETDNARYFVQLAKQEDTAFRPIQELCNNVLKPYYLERLERNKITLPRFYQHLEDLEGVSMMQELLLAVTNRRYTQKMRDFFSAPIRKELERNLDLLPINKAYSTVKSTVKEYEKLKKERQEGILSVGELSILVEWKVSVSILSR